MATRTTFADGDCLTVRELFEALRPLMQRGKGDLPVRDVAESTVGSVEALEVDPDAVYICRVGMSARSRKQEKHKQTCWVEEMDVDGHTVPVRVHGDPNMDVRSREALHALTQAAYRQFAEEQHTPMERETAEALCAEYNALMERSVELPFAPTRPYARERAALHNRRSRLLLRLDQAGVRYTINAPGFLSLEGEATT